MIEKRLENIKSDADTNTRKEYEFVTTLLYDDIHWLIEQAERVRELEGKVEELTRLYNSKNSDYLKEKAMREQSWKQNKCYREAREMIEQVYKENYVRNAYGYEDGYLDGLDTAISIIDEALEVEE